MTTYDLENLRVLVVDDSPYMISIVETLLTAMGVAEVRGVPDGRTAISELRAWQPDLLITDHMMKPVSGLDVIQQIRDLDEERLRFVPIILMTGHAHQGVVNQARFRAGADAVLVKPVTARRLFDCIVSLYESARTFVRTGTYFGPDRRAPDRPFEGLNQDFDGPWNPYASPGIPFKLQDESLELELVSLEPGAAADEVLVGRRPADEDESVHATTGDRSA